MSQSTPNWPGQALSLLIRSQPFLAKLYKKPWATGVLGTAGAPGGVVSLSLALAIGGGTRKLDLSASQS